MKQYRLKTNGRRAVAALALAALIGWGWALWKLQDVLSSESVQISYGQPGTFAQAITQGLTVSQIVPALLLLVLIVALPVLLWNLIEEWSTTYTVRDDGLIYDTVQGISVLYPWHTIKSVRRADPDAREPAYEMIVSEDGICQISSRVLRWLHQQAFGSTRVPIYAHVVDRDELLHEIVMRSGLKPSKNQEPRIENQQQPISS